MAATTTTPILEKIKKLLALSEGRGTTEAEASLAAEHVQRMLQDHGLTLAQVEAAGGGSDEGAKRGKTTTGHKAMYAYQRELMATIAQNNFCLYMVKQVFVPNEKRGTYPGIHPETGEFTRGYKSSRHLLVGRELNVAVTIQIYEYLVEALTRTSPYDHRGSDGKRFLEGGVSRISERLAEYRTQREAESETTRTAPTAGNGTHTELVLTDVYGTEADLNNDTLNGFPAGTTAAKRREQDARRAAQIAEHNRLVSEGVDTTVAWYRAYGYGEERAMEMAKSFVKTSRRGGRGRTRNWTRGDDAHYAKINSESYRAGRVAGAGIGLDDQIGATKRKQIGEG